MNLKVSEIAEMCGGRLVGSGENTVTSFYTDSRETTPGKMFVPIRGENTDAHRFIPQVFASGAAATFSEEPLDAPAGDVVYVENTRAALQKVAERYRERFNIPVIGITGSVGKTTTKEMVALAVSAGLKTMKTAGNANSQIGLPMTVLRITPEDEAAVVEMGVSMPGEMARIKSRKAEHRRHDEYRRVAHRVHENTREHHEREVRHHGLPAKRQQGVRKRR